MVRRGSTVRVRQRALQKRRTSALSRSGQLASRRTCGGYGAVYGAFASRTRVTGRPSGGPALSVMGPDATVTMLLEVSCRGSRCCKQSFVEAALDGFLLDLDPQVGEGHGEKLEGVALLGLAREFLVVPFLERQLAGGVCEQVGGHAGRLERDSCFLCDQARDADPGGVEVEAGVEAHAGLEFVESQ